MGAPFSSRPVRIFGPLRSCSTATERPPAIGGGADARVDRGVRLVRAVREVEPEDVDAGGDQLVEHRVGTAGRTERGDDLGVPHGVQLTIGTVMGQVVPSDRRTSTGCTVRSTHPRRIDRDGRAEGLPLVNPASARLLRTLAIATGARRILEIGTAIGYRRCGSPARSHPTAADLARDGPRPRGAGTRELRARRPRGADLRDRRRRGALPPQGRGTIRSRVPGRREIALRAAARPAGQPAAARRAARERQRALERAGGRGRRRAATIPRRWRSAPTTAASPQTRAC